MPRGGARPGAGRKKRAPAEAPGALPPPAAADGEQTPLEYMLAEMRNPMTPPDRRDRLAVAAAPYVHKKLGEGGAKVPRTPKEGGGKFAASPMPLKLVANKK